MVFRAVAPLGCKRYNIDTLRSAVSGGGGSAEKRRGLGINVVKRSDVLTVWALIGVAGVVQLLRVLAPSDSVWAGVAVPQAVVFPLFFIALWRIAIVGARVPRGVVVLAAVCAVGASGFSFTWRGDRTSDFLIARLRGDAVEAESKIFRDRINSEIPAGSTVRAVRYYREVENETEARETLRSNRNVPAVVWGGGRWISVSFAGGAGTVRLGDVAPQFSLAPDLVVVTDVSRFDMSRQPDQVSAAFIAKLLSGLLPERRVNGVVVPPTGLGVELTLRDAGQLIGRWVSYAHRGVPALALGNLYLLGAVSDERVDIGALRCAIGMYTFGQGLFRAGEHRELAMALANNEGVARTILGFISGDEGEFATAAELWRLAQRGTRDEVGLQGPLHARLAAWLNGTQMGIADAPAQESRRARRVRG